MGFPNEKDPAPQLHPTTGRTGGRSARLVAVAVVVVLAAVVYVGATDRSPSVFAPTSPPTTTITVARASPQPALSTPAPDDDERRVVPIIDPSKPPQYQYVGMAL